MLEYAYLIPLLPLAVSLVILFSGKEDPLSPLPYLGITAMGFCLAYSLLIFHAAATGGLSLPYEANWRWFNFAADIGGKSFSCERAVSVIKVAIHAFPPEHLCDLHGCRDGVGATRDVRPVEKIVAFKPAVGQRAAASWPEPPCPHRAE
jgi:hypothetical protein